MLLVIVAERAIPHILSGNLFDTERPVFRFSYRDAAHIRAMRQHDIEEIARSNRQPLEVMLFKARVTEAETRDSHSQLRQLNGLKFFCGENMHIARPGFFPVGRSLSTGVMVPGRDEYTDHIQACQLLFNEFEGVRSNAFQFKKISGNKQEVHFIRPGVLNDTAESGSNSLSFPISQPRKPDPKNSLSR